MTTFNRPDDGGHDWQQQYARAYTGRTNSNSYESQTNYDPGEIERLYANAGTTNNGRSNTSRFLESEQEARRLELEEKEDHEDYVKIKTAWKAEHPDQNLKYWKKQYIRGKIDKLPWEDFYDKPDNAT